MVPADLKSLLLFIVMEVVLADILIIAMGNGLVFIITFTQEEVGKLAKPI
jgi:hypothetical protein